MRGSPAHCNLLRNGRKCPWFLKVLEAHWRLPLSSGLSPFLGTEPASSRCVRKIKSWDYFVPLPKEGILTRGDAQGFPMHSSSLSSQPALTQPPAQGQSLRAERALLPASDPEILLCKLNEQKAVFLGVCLESDFSSILWKKTQGHIYRHTHAHTLRPTLPAPPPFLTHWPFSHLYEFLTNELWGHLQLLQSVVFANELCSFAV